MYAPHERNRETTRSCFVLRRSPMQPALTRASTAEGRHAAGEARAPRTHKSLEPTTIPWHLHFVWEYLHQTHRQVRPPLAALWLVCVSGGLDRDPDAHVMRCASISRVTVARSPSEISSHSCESVSRDDSFSDTRALFIVTDIYKRVTKSPHGVLVGARSAKRAARAHVSLTPRRSR